MVGCLELEMMVPSEIYFEWGRGRRELVGWRHVQLFANITRVLDAVDVSNCGVTDEWVDDRGVCRQTPNIQNKKRHESKVNFFLAKQIKLCV